MKILIIGATGQIGTDLLKVFAQDVVIPLSHTDIEVCDFTATRKMLTAHHPDVIINTSAYHQVDLCEEEGEKAFMVNALAVRNLALVARDLNLLLIHFSTDYVFDGRKKTPYAEEDSPCPLSVYAASKLAGEYFVRTICPRHILVRTCGLYGAAGSRRKGGNFVETMIRSAREGRPIRVVADQIVAPTSSKELAHVMGVLLEQEREIPPEKFYGLYHITNSGQCSWYEFARTIFHLCGIRANLSPTTGSEYGAPAKRPAYSILAHNHLLSLGLSDLRPWQEALREYLTERGHRGKDVEAQT